VDVRWIKHAGKDILYVDYRGAKDEVEMLGLLRRAIEIEASLSEKKVELCNFEGTFGSAGMMAELNKSGKQRNEKMAKVAVIGISGVKKVLFNSYIAVTGSSNVRIFEDESKALDWLAE
jgi:hypothetical protein